MVVNKASNNMTLEKIYNKWFSIQPLSEVDQNSIVLMPLWFRVSGKSYSLQMMKYHTLLTSSLFVL